MTVSIKNYTIIDEADAPAAPKVERVNENQVMALDVLTSLGKGKAAAIVLEATDSFKAVKRAFTTVAKREGISFTQWKVDNTLYVKRAS